MNAVEKPDYATLRWVKEGLDETIAQARQALESYVEGGYRADDIKAFQRHVHQLLGTLRMVQVHGGGMVVEEMERVAQALADGHLQGDERLVESLMLGLVQLPNYLQRLEKGEPDIPLVLLPVINDLRAARNEAPASEIVLYAPNLNRLIEREPVIPGSGNPNIPQLLKNERPRYHRGLISWYRNQSGQEGLEAVLEVIRRINAVAGTRRLRRLMDSVEALIVILMEGEFGADDEVKQLFSRLDRVFKELIKHGEEQAMKDFPIELLKNILYFVSRSHSHDSVVQSVRRTADLANSFPDQIQKSPQEVVAATDDNTLAAVFGELQNELAAVQEGLDLYMRGDREEIHRLQGLSDRLRKVADTLGMLGRGALRQRLAEVADELAEMERGQRQPTDDALMLVATTMVQAEGALMAPDKAPPFKSDQDHEPDQAQEAHDEAVIREAFAEFSRIKQGLERYLHDFREHQRLDEVAQEVHKLASVFQVIELKAVSELLSQAEPELKRLAEQQVELSPYQRSALVDLFAALDYYLEARLDGRSNLSEILALAEQSLHQFTAEPHDAEGQAHPEFLELAQATPSAAPSPEEVAEETKASEETTTAPAQGEAVDQAAQAPEVAQEAAVSAEPQHLMDEGEEPSSAEAAIEAPTEQPAAIEEEAPKAAAASSEGPVAEEPPLQPMDEIDPEIFDIFVEEAREELAVIQEQYPRWRQDPTDESALQTFRRSFHTLKGSGRMVGANVIGEFAWSVENLLNRIMDGTLSVDADVLAFLDEAIEAVPLLLEAQEAGKPVALDVQGLQARGFALAEGKRQAVAEEVDQGELAPADVATEVADEVEQEESAPQEAPPQAPAIELPEELYDIFRGESESHLQVLADYLARCQGGQCPMSQEVVRAIHTLRGSSHLAEVEPMARLSEEMERYCNHLNQLGRSCGEQELLLLQGFHDTVKEMLGAINVSGSSLPDSSELLEAIRQAEQALPDVVSDLQPGSDSELIEEPAAEKELLDNYLDEAAGILDQLDADYQRWVETDDLAAVEALKSGLHALTSGARRVGFMPLGELAAGLEAFYDAIRRSDGSIDQDTRERAHKLVEAIENAFDALHLNGKLPDLSDKIRAANELAAQAEKLIPEEEPETEITETQEPESILLADHWNEEKETDFHPEASSLDLASSRAGSELSAPQASEPRESLRPLPEDVDPELLDVFLEEAGELTERMEEHLVLWENNLTDHEAIDGLMRSLHTLKGNARFANLFDIGNLAHALESLFENLAEGRLQADPALKPLVRQGVDRLETSIEMLQAGRGLLPLNKLTQALEAAAANQGWELPSVEVESELSAMADSALSVVHSELSAEQSSLHEVDSSLVASSMLTDSELLAESETPAGDDRIIPFPGVTIRQRKDRQRPPPLRAEEEQTGKGERVRVLAELLDQLVNNAGEVSIYRARLERQNMRVQQNLEELNATIARLQSQLRALELETEAQILSRHERKLDEGGYEDFDPLEMDRYSNIQQLSRALSETIADLSNIGESLSEQTRDADTLLLQQARITNDLQDGLLRSRMVPFKRQASRLQRVVRQTAQTLGKQAELKVTGAEGEIDRTILNRIMGPLEHLLRNAVAHGIEPPEKRRQLGKPEVGEVSLVMAREGSEVVLTIADDGAGLDAGAIRRKAVQNGLLEVGAEVDEETLYQFILQPGFTTAAEVTQVAGRGVGMDAVVSEIKQLGGSLEIFSKRGRGSRFVIHLPFTLAISEALLVKVAEDVYAIPHGATEVIIRVTREDLLACYKGQSEGIEYGGHTYPVRYMGSMLGVAEPVLPDNIKWFPLLLARAGEQRMAIQVDQLLGNQQVVVKSIGAQLAGVRWFTGGTILADGKIALLLDMNALIRSTAVAQAPAPLAPEPEVKGITVMVVDDSITVRKVTSRLLERHNMNVITARDGVDAITVLQERKPDVMLLDIEMPRMDGYELARHIRNTPELEDIPIIMITSRTGQKHRERALELGVNRYLGKPYQETDLMENIYALLGEQLA